MGDRGAAVRRAASPAAEEAPKKQKVGDTGHVRNANDVHTNGHVKNICLPTDYELNRYDKLYNKRRQVDTQVCPNQSPAYARHVLLCASFFSHTERRGWPRGTRQCGAHTRMCRMARYIPLTLS